MPTLRQAAKDDIMLIHELALQAFPATYRDLLSQEQMDFMMDWMYSPANLEKQMEEGHVYFIASHQGEDCGYLSVQPEGPGVFHKIGRAVFQPSVKNIVNINKIFIMKRYISYERDYKNTPSDSD